MGEIIVAVSRASTTLPALITFVFVILVLNFAHIGYRLMGRTGALAIGRAMQIFIVAIGVKFCMNSLASMFPQLVGSP